MRFRVAFEIAVRDGDEEGLRSFAAQLQWFVDHNVPAFSGWAKIDNPTITPAKNSYLDMDEEL